MGLVVESTSSPISNHQKTDRAIGVWSLFDRCELGLKFWSHGKKQNHYNAEGAYAKHRTHSLLQF